MAERDEPAFSTHERKRLGGLIEERGRELEFDVKGPDLDSTEVIKSVEDLPDPVDGLHPLESMTAYFFDGYITSDHGLELGFSTPLIAEHGASGGFIHTGGQSAIVGDNSGFYARDIYIHAPGGTIYDLTSDTTSEILAESITHSDAIGMGNIEDLGVIDGFRVPTWIGCNFEDFDAGLTLTGTSEKVFISSSPFRGVSASGVTILELGPGFETDLMEVVDSYVKGVQPDTEVIRVDPQATIHDQLQYRGTVHDSTVTKENILAGDADPNVEPYTVSGSYPVSDTSVYINWSLQDPTTVTINQQATDKLDEAAYETISGNILNKTAGRFEPLGDGVVEYTGRKEISAYLQAFIVAGSGDDEALSVAFFHNGSIVGGTDSRFFARTAPGNTDLAGYGMSAGVVQNMETNDVVSVRVANLDSTNDLDVGEVSGNINKE